MQNCGLRTHLAILHLKHISSSPVHSRHLTLTLLLGKRFKHALFKVAEITCLAFRIMKKPAQGTCASILKSNSFDYLPLMHHADMQQSAIRVMWLDIHGGVTTLAVSFIRRYNAAAADIYNLIEWTTSRHCKARTICADMAVGQETSLQA